MTKSDFIYGLKACGCLYEDGKTYYEHDELVKCFEDLGLIEDSKTEQKDETPWFASIFDMEKVKEYMKRGNET